jgi:hypothetical protein
VWQEKDLAWISTIVSLLKARKHFGAPSCPATWRAAGMRVRKGAPFEAPGRAVHLQYAGEVRRDALEVFDSRGIVESRIVAVKVHFYPGTFEQFVSYGAGSRACRRRVA